MEAVPAHLDTLAAHAVARAPRLLSAVQAAGASCRWHDGTTTATLRLGLDGLLGDVAAVVDRLGDMDRWAGHVGAAIALADADGRLPHGLASAPVERVFVPSLPVPDAEPVPGGPGLAGERFTFDHLPPGERDRRLRALVGDHVARLPPLGPHDDAEARAERRLLQQVADGELTHTADGHPVLLLAFRGAAAGPDGVPRGDAALQVAVGDLDAADAALVWVPGTGHGVDDLALELVYADRLRRRAERHHAADLAVVVDLYDGPDVIQWEAVSPAWGQRQGPDLRAVTAEARSRTGGHTTVVGHSYGT